MSPIEASGTESELLSIIPYSRFDPVQVYRFIDRIFICLNGISNSQVSDYSKENDAGAGFRKAGEKIKLLIKP